MSKETEHEHLDPQSALRRLVSLQVEQQARLDKMEPVLMVVDARTAKMDGKLDRVLAMPRAVQYAAIVASVALMVIAYAAMAMAHR